MNDYVEDLIKEYSL